MQKFAAAAKGLPLTPCILKFTGGPSQNSGDKFVISLPFLLRISCGCGKIMLYFKMELLNLKNTPLWKRGAKEGLYMKLNLSSKIIEALFINKSPLIPLFQTEHWTQILLNTEKRVMKRNLLINSPLKKGDKGGCEPEVGALSSRDGRRNKKQPPPPPFLRGNISEILRYCPCPPVLMGKGRFFKEGNIFTTFTSIFVAQPNIVRRGNN